MENFHELESGVFFVEINKQFAAQNKSYETNRNAIIIVKTRVFNVDYQQQNRGQNRQKNQYRENRQVCERTHLMKIFRCEWKMRGFLGSVKNRIKGTTYILMSDFLNLKSVAENSAVSCLCNLRKISRNNTW